MTIVPPYLNFRSSSATAHKDKDIHIIAQKDWFELEIGLNLTYVLFCISTYIRIIVFKETP